MATVQVLKCPRCAQQATWSNGKWNCETCAKLDRVKRMTCSHIGAHFEGKKWICGLCEELKASFLLHPTDMQIETIKALRNAKDIYNLAKIPYAYAESVYHNCGEDCAPKENQSDYESNMPIEGKTCSIILEGKKKFANWINQFKELQTRGNITITPLDFGLAESERKKTWSIRTWPSDEIKHTMEADGERDFEDAFWRYDVGIKRHYERREVGQHEETYTKEHKRRRTGETYYTQHKRKVSDYADFWLQERAEKDETYGFLAQNEQVLEPSSLKVKVEYSININGLHGSWWMIHEIALTGIESAISETELKDFELTPEMILERANAIYQAESVKRGIEPTSPEPEELEESGLIDQAKEELKQEIEQVTPEPIIETPQKVEEIEEVKEQPIVEPERIEAIIGGSNKKLEREEKSIS